MFGGSADSAVRQALEMLRRKKEEAKRQDATARFPGTGETD